MATHNPVDGKSVSPTSPIAIGTNDRETSEAGNLQRVGTKPVVSSRCITSRFQTTSASLLIVCHLSRLAHRICRPEQANRAAAGTSVSSIDVVCGTRCQIAKDRFAPFRQKGRPRSGLPGAQSGLGVRWAGHSVPSRVLAPLSGKRLQ